MSTNKEETLRQFCDVTGANEGRSKFFLESSNWQLDVALSSFYEHGGNADEAPSNPASAAPSLPILSDSDMESPTGSPQPAQKKDKKKPVNTKFATLDSLQQESSSEDEEEWNIDWLKKRIQTNKYLNSIPASSNMISTMTENDGPVKLNDHEVLQELERLKETVERLLCENEKLKKEMALQKDESYTKVEKCESPLKDEIAEGQNELKEGQAFYAGGSERSGQQIIGPGKGRKDIVTEVFKSVRERGAVVFEDEPLAAGSRSRGVFSGAGYRLGQTTDDHEQVAPPGQQPQSADQPRSVRLRLYREGFSVDSGPLRQYTDPDHAEFLNCIRRGEIPSELAGSGEVRVSLEDRRHEECPRNVGKSQAFSGKGQMLGSPTPPTVGATAPVASAGVDREANQRAAQLHVGLDDSAPTTTIQFRLADGSRLTGRFNHTHTVADLHQYVSRAEPGYQLQNFVLLTTFPSTELSDPAATLAQANVLNSTLMQRLK